MKVYNGRGEIEKRIKDGKNTLRWDKTSMGVLAYDLLHIIRKFYLFGEEVRRSMELLIQRLINVGAKVVYHAPQWHVHVTSTFTLTCYYRAMFGHG